MAEASPSTLDLAGLAEPIAPDAPSGADPREGERIFELRRLRKAARSVEDRADTGEATDQAPETAWREVLQGSLELLAEAKDLELCAYLCEAGLRCHGLAGLRDGFLLTQTLVERHWDTLHPQGEEPAARARVFESLNGRDGNGTLPQPLRKLKVTEEGAQAWQAKATLEGSDEEARSTLKRAAQVTGSAFYARLQADLVGCTTAYDALGAAFVERCGERGAPASAGVRKALEELAITLASLAADLPPPPSLPVAVAGNGSTPMAPQAVQQPVAIDGVATREQALRLIEAAAAYFRRAEPHSPTAWALETVMRRSRMGLPELLEDLLGQDDARERFLTAAGIKLERPRDE